MLAIVIPYYKINYFNETIKSLSEQTDKRFVVYIGNDNSSDDPLCIISKYNTKLNIVYKKFNQNFGSISLVKQWNRCLELVNNEEWVIILGDDDVVSNNLVESFYESFESFKELYSVVRFATYKIDDNSKVYTELFTNPEIEKSTKIISEKKRSSLSEYAFRKVKLDEIKIKDFPLAWHSDLLAVLEFSNYGNIYSINSSNVKVRISEISISGKRDNLKQKEEAKFMFYKYIIDVANHKLDDKTKISIEENLNKVYINDKKRIFRLKTIFFLYFKKGKIKSIFKLFSSIIKNI